MSGQGAGVRAHLTAIQPEEFAMSTTHSSASNNGDLYNVTRSEPPEDPVHISASETLMWTSDLECVNPVTLYTSPCGVAVRGNQANHTSMRRKTPATAG
jgi:hypothetical protein